MMWESSTSSSSNGSANNTASTVTAMTEDCCIDVSECASLITNSFTLNSGGPRPVAQSRRPSGATRQRHPLASLLHFEGNTSNIHEDDEESRSPVQKRMLTDDFSLYDAENSQQGVGGGQAVLPLVSGSPRTTCSMATSPVGLLLDTDDEEDEDDVMLPSADNSPVTFKVLDNNNSNKKMGKKSQKSFDDATIDSNSMDSGYGTSLTGSNSNGQFRFVQPTGMAPRRLDSGIASPIIPSSSTLSNSGSKQSRSSFSVFNSCSSQGSLESMEEDYLDLFRLEDEGANGSYRLSAAAGGSAMTTTETATSAQKLAMSTMQARSSLNMDMPSDISSLICGAIKSSPSTPAKKTRVRRCLLMDESTVSASSGDEENKENSSPAMIISRVSQQKKETNVLMAKRTNLMMLDGNSQQGKAFKRPEPLMISPVQSKRYKSEVFSSRSVCFSGARTADPRLEQFSFDAEKCVSMRSTGLPGSAQPPLLQRAVSMNETMIKNALSRSSSDPDLIGDFTKPFCLPHTEGRHNDLRSISVDTMAQLVQGDFNDSVASFKIVDCRYPYEFEGGHIRSAKNLYTQEQILEELVTPIAGEAKIEGGASAKRHILVFHCEFSSERGPKLFRFLRSHDRLCNENAYPALHYPEIYLLDGGYKAFYESHPELCDPINYRQMLDPAYGQEYKTFRAKTKSWNGDNGRATTFKRTKSRSRVML